MEKEFNEVELRRKLGNLTSWKQQVFLLAVCQRMLPVFDLFALETGATGSVSLNNMLQNAWMHLLSGVSEADFLIESGQAESFAPDTDDYESKYVSAALDAAHAISILMKSFNDFKTDDVVEAVSFIRDSVDMQIQVIEAFELVGVETESQILEHPLMQNELKRQREDIAFLELLSDNLLQSSPSIKARWYHVESSYLDGV